jgi:hypothetical protein
MEPNMSVKGATPVSGESFYDSNAQHHRMHTPAGAVRAAETPPAQLPTPILMQQTPPTPLSETSIKAVAGAQQACSVLVPHIIVTQDQQAYSC